MKKLNIAILIVLLVFQTILSPVSVFADGVDVGEGVTLPNTEETQSGIGDADVGEAQGSLSGGIQTLSSSPDTAGVEINENIVITSTVKLYDSAPYNEDGTLNPSARELKDYTPTFVDNFSAYVAFEWEVPDSPAYKANDTFTFNLPVQFANGREVEDDLMSDGEVIGTFKVSATNEVTFTFKEDPNGLKGYFYIGRGLNKGNLGDSTNIGIPFDFKGDSVKIPIKFESPVSGMTKSGKADRDMNPSKIDWTVDLNKSESKITGAKFKDTLPTGLEVDINSIDITKLNISLDGDVSTSSETIDESNISVDKDNVLTFDLGNIQDAYRVTYTTNVTGEFAGSKTFTNKAELLGGTTTESKTADVSVNFNKPLTKKPVNKGYNAVDGTILWEVEYNYNQKNVDGILNDTLTGNHTFEEIVSIEKVDINRNGQAQNPTTLPNPNNYVNGSAVGTKAFTLDLSSTSPNGQAYKIVYKTKLDTRVEGSTKVGNTITMQNGISSGLIETTVSQIILDKSYSVNYKTKEITWTLKVNQDARPMANFILKDTFAGQNLSLDKISVKGSSGTVKLIDDTNTVSDSVETTTRGFEIHYTSLNVPEEITYVTKFDPANYPGQNYKNKAEIGWWDGTTFTPIEGSKQEVPVNPGNYTKENGNKTGAYNAKTKEITWTVITNYNLNYLSNAVFKDTFKGNQIFLPESFKVEKLTLDAGEPGNDNNGATIPGTEVCTGTACLVTHSGNNIEYTIGETSAAYRITYKTSLEGKEVSTIYSNKATLQDGENPPVFDKIAKVPPTNGNKYIDKVGKQGIGDKEDLAHWKVTINPSQSYVAGGSTVTDTITGDQKLLKDSFELYEVEEIPTNGTINNADIIDLPNNSELKLSDPLTLSEAEGADYHLQVTDDSFTLTFKNDIEKPYILVYDSFIMGDNGDPISNSVSFKGHTATSDQDSKESGFDILWDVAGGGAVNGKGYLKIIKVDENTSKPLSGAEFELWNASGDVFLEKLVTDANGEAVTTKKYKYKTYLVKETKAPEGYLIPTDDTKKFIKDSKDVGIITITNKVDSSKTCSYFTFTLRDTDGNVRPLVTVDIINNDGILVKKVETDENGQVKLLSPFEEGSYKVFEGKADLGTINVSFIPGECQGEVSLTPACPVFTITVKDVNGVLSTNKNIIIKNSVGNIITDANYEDGILTLPDSTPEGDYFVYDEEGNPLGKVNVSFKAGLCQAEVQPDPSNACKLFTITVKDEDGIVKKDAKVSVVVDIKDATTGIITTKTLELTTKDEGQVTLPSGTVPGKYTVTDTLNPSKNLGNIKVSYKDGECQGEVKYPRTCDIFTITIKGQDGNIKPNAKVIVEDSTGTKVSLANDTTDAEGKIHLPQNQAPGDYTVYEQNVDSTKGVEIGEVKVTYTGECKDEVKPQPPVTPPGSGGGGSTPPPTETPDPEQPGKPGEETPDPEQPGNPGEETPDPEQPGKPGEETPDPEQPGNPGEETPDPETPGTPGEETPDPDQPGKPGEETTKPEKPTSPELDKVIDKIPSLPGVTPVPGESPDTPKYEVPNIPQIVEELKQDPTKLIQTNEELKEFINMYNNLSPEEQAEIDKLIDMNALKNLQAQLDKEAAKFLAANKNQEKLPQTDNANQTGMMLGGLLLVGMSLVLLRRKWASSTK